MNPRKAVCFLAAFLIAVVPVALAQGTYTQIDVPGSAATFIYGVNSAGDIVGLYETSKSQLHGFLLSEGTYTTIDHPGSVYTWLTGINDVGQIVGFRDDPVVGFLYDIATRTFTTVSYPGAAHTFAWAINNAGTIAGNFYDVNGNEYGFWLVGTSYKRIVPPHVAKSSVYGITTSGEVAGRVEQPLPIRYFLFEHGKPKKYKRITIPDAPGAQLAGINPEGTALVGSYTPSARGTFAFLYQNKIFQTLRFPGSIITFATGINAAGEVIGIFYDASGLAHGFTWTPPADAAKK